MLMDNEASLSFLVVFYDIQNKGIKRLYGLTFATVSLNK